MPGDDERASVASGEQPPGSRGEHQTLASFVALLRSPSMPTPLKVQALQRGLRRPPVAPLPHLDETGFSTGLCCGSTADHDLWASKAVGVLMLKPYCFVGPAVNDDFVGGCSHIVSHTEFPVWGNYLSISTCLTHGFFTSCECCKFIVMVLDTTNDT